MEVARVFHTYSPSNLPSGMIGLATEAGQTLRENADVINVNMIDRFANQVNRKYCGPASLALLMNALNLAYHIRYQGIKPFSKEEELLKEEMSQGPLLVDENDIVNAPHAQDFLKSVNVNENGLTLPHLASLTAYTGLGVNTYFAYPEGVALNETSKNELIEREKKGDEYIFRSVEEFRNFALNYLGRPVTGLIVNYFMGALGYEGLRGHFSPLAAYHAQEDRFLVMDVWPDTPPAWVKTEQLFNAMSTVDSDSGLPRGLLHIHELL